MNKATMDSIQWHKDQLFKLLEDGDLFKIEGDIHSVKSLMGSIGLGESQGVGDHGIQVYHDIYIEKRN